MPKAIIPAPLEQLTRALDDLPGIGPKAAARLSRKLTHSPELARQLMQALTTAQNDLGLCGCCRSYTVDSECPVCDGQWQGGQPLRIVQLPEQIADLREKNHHLPEPDAPTNWFVLHGLLSPVDGIGPRQLGLEYLQQRLSSDAERPSRMDAVLEDSVEAQTTAFYLETLAEQAGIVFAAHHVEGVLQPR